MNATPALKRRSFLKLGIGSAIVLALAGGTMALMKPGLVDGKLSQPARLVMTRVAQAMLAEFLPIGARGAIQSPAPYSSSGAPVT